MTIIKPILVTAAVLICCMGNEYPANAQLGNGMAKCWRSNDPYCREHPMDRVLPRETKCETRLAYRMFGPKYLETVCR